MNLNTLNPMDVINALIHHQWLLPSAVAIGLIIRLLKSDTKIPFTLPPAMRSWGALVLGSAVGIIDKAIEAGNTTWTVSLLQGVGVGVFAMVMHALLIGSLRDGKEIPIPGLIIPGAPPSPGKPPTLPVKQPTIEIPVDVIAVAQTSENPMTTGDIATGQPPTPVATVPELPRADSIPPPKA